MKKLSLLLASLFVTFCAAAQITTNPAVIPLGYKGKIVVTFDPTGTGMAGETTCYAHTGVTTTEKGNWTCAPDWKTNTDKYKLTKSGTKWVLTIDDLHTYYDCALYRFLHPRRTFPHKTHCNPDYRKTFRAV